MTMREWDWKIKQALEQREVLKQALKNKECHMFEDQKTVDVEDLVDTPMQEVTTNDVAIETQMHEHCIW